MQSMQSESYVASLQAEVVIARDVARVFPSHPRIQQVRLEIAEVLRNYARQAQCRSKCNDAVNALTVCRRTAQRPRPVEDFLC